MPAFLRRSRYVVVAGVSLALFVGGVVSGAAGSPLLIGAQNVAGTATTSLTAATDEAPGFDVVQAGGGPGLRSTAPAGPAGYFESSDGVALHGVARHRESYGASVFNTSERPGSGAALRASSDANVAIFATSEDRSPIYVSGPTDVPPLVVNSPARVDKLHADAVDGWSLGCPPLTIRSQGLCFGPAPAPAASAWHAADACQSLEGGGYQYRLPSAQQLRAARDVDGIDLDAAGEHADGVSAGDGDVIETVVVFDDGTVSAVPATDVHPFRCITDPMAIDLALIPADERERYPATAGGE